MRNLVESEKILVYYKQKKTCAIDLTQTVYKNPRKNRIHVQATKRVNRIARERYYCKLGELCECA